MKCTPAWNINIVHTSHPLSLNPITFHHIAPVSMGCTHTCLTPLAPAFILSINTHSAPIQQGASGAAHWVGLPSPPPLCAGNNPILFTHQLVQNSTYAGIA